MQECGKDLTHGIKVFGMKKYRMTVLTLLLAAALAAVGLTRGEAKEVLMKAVRVCLECIGVG